MARFLESAPNSGFDDSEQPPWLVVGTALPKLVVLQDAVGWRISSTAPAIVTVTPATSAQHRQRLLISGLTSGTAVVEARSPQGQVLALRVVVKHLRTVSVGFYFVRDSASPEAHHTRRTEAQVDPALELVNSIYLPQAILGFSKFEVRPITVPGDLGSSVYAPTFPSPALGRADDEFRAVTEAGRPLSSFRADKRVFFVWSVHSDTGRRGTDTEGMGEIRGHDAMVEDRTSEDLGLVLAHELGHTLGLEHVQDRRCLMYPTTAGGRKIPKRQLDILRRS